MSAPLPAALVAYRIGLSLLSPAAPHLLRWRARKGKEDPARLDERRGMPGKVRPRGELVWLHGASVGETVSLLALVDVLVARGLNVVVTSGTRTSAEVLGRRLPPGSQHQFMPLDVPRYVGRFLDHWRPCLALFAESEIWPTAITELERRQVPLVLVNARLSPRSAARWARAPRVARALFGRVALTLAQGQSDAERLRQAGAERLEVAGNLKFDTPPPPADPAALEALSSRLAGRPVWMAASTHPGEEAAILAAHEALKRRFPALLTIVTPRHPERGREVETLAREVGLDANRRSEGERPDAAADIHVADTIGELGLFYRLAPLVFMGGSLVPRGGQNPIEPARLGTAILHGPHIGNFEEVYASLDADGGALAVPDANALAAAAADLLDDPSLMRDMARAASGTVSALGGALERTLAAIEPFLPAPRPAGDALW
jgi:3-deoxy-D-manno-octulosonic-acid transferase